MTTIIPKDLDPDDSLTDLESFNRSGKRCILFAGGIIFSDRVPFLDSVSKQMPRYRFVLMCENLRNRKNVHNKFREYLDSNPGSRLDYFPVPNRLMRDNHEKNRIKDVAGDISDTVESISYLRDSAENLRRRYNDMGDGYPEYLVYWIHVYLIEVLDTVDPIAVIIWNKFHIFNAILDGICKERGIRTMYMEYGVLPGTFCLEQDGQMGESFPARHPDDFSNLPVGPESLDKAQKTWDYLYESKLNRKQQPQNDKLARVLELTDPSKRTVLYLGVNDYESGICPYTEHSKKFHSPIFGSSDEAVSYLAELSYRNGWNLIYKPHPIVAGDVDIHRSDNGVIYVSDVDLNDLIDISDVVVTILSQSGYVSSIRCKATVLLGYTQLYGKGITYEATKIDDVESSISDALEHGFTEFMESAFLRHIAQASDYYLLDDQSNKRMVIGMSYKQCVKFIESTLEGHDQMQSMLAANSVGTYVGNSISVDRSVREVRDFASNLTKPVILTVGHILYDNETDYIYQIAKRMRDYRFVHLTLHYRAKYDRVYNPDYVSYRNTDPNDLRIIKFFIAPELFTKDHYPKHYPMEITSEMEELMASDECVRNASINLRLFHRDMGEGYAENFACEAFRYINDVLDALNPKVVVMWNKFHAFNSILDHVCKKKGIRTLYMEFGSLPGTYSLEPLGQMGESAVSRYGKDFMNLKVDEKDLGNAKSVLRYLKESSLTRRKQADTDLTELKARLDNGRPTILYAGQNDYESGLVPYTMDTWRYHSPNFRSSRDALDYLAAMADRNGWNLVYKPHPIMTRYNEETGYPDNAIVIDADINRLIDMCDVTTTILSQVSYVSLIRDKPVVMLGYTQLKDKGCTYEAFDMDSMDAVFLEAISRGYTRKQRDSFVRHTAQIIHYYLLDNIDDKKDIKYLNNVSMAVTQVLMAADGYGGLFLPSDEKYIETVSDRSEKDLIQAQDIVDVIERDSVKIVSFDIFDTLLERPLMDPADIHRIVGRRLGLEYDFPKYRDIAQRLAGQNKPRGNDSVTLDEIYRQLARLTGEDGDRLREIAEEEMAVESDYLCPRTLGMRLYRAAVDSGKRIIITSDMYLPEEFIASVLKKNGYTGYSALFVSCTSMRSKKTGRLYDHIIDSLGRSVKPSEIMHIGDNATADFIRAREHGLTAVHIPKASDLFRKVAPLSVLYRYIDKNMDNSFLLGYLANRIFEDPYTGYDRQSSFNGKAGNMALLIYSPLMLIFMKWLMDDLSRDSKDEIYFLSRDGYVPNMIYDKFKRFYKGIPQGEEMYLNRSLMYAFCAYSPNGLVDADLKYPPSSKMRVEDYVRNRIYASDESELKEIMKVLDYCGYHADDEIKGLLNDYDTRMKLNPYFIKNLRPRADALRDYYKTRLGSRNIAIFDVGYRGRACRFLMDELGYSVTEYHIISRPEVRSFVERGYDVRSLIDLSNLTIDRAEIAFILLDTILSIQEPGIRCIDPSVDGASWTHERDDVFTETIKTIQDCMMENVAEMSDVFAKDWHLLHFDPYPFVDLMTESLSKPSPKDAQIFRSQNTPNEPAFIDLSKKSNIARWVKANSKSRPEPVEKPSFVHAVQRPADQMPIEVVSSSFMSILDRLHLTGICRRMYELYGSRFFGRRR